MNSKIIFLLIIAVSVFGIGITSFLTYHHYSGSNICTISERFSCDVVNKSVYSELFGVPVAAMGLSYFVFVIASLALLKNNKKVLLYILLVSLPVIAYSLYLTSVELFVLNTICVFCESTKVLIFFIIILSAFELQRNGIFKQLMK